MGAVRASFGYMSTIDDSLVRYTFILLSARSFNGSIETGAAKFYK